MDDPSPSSPPPASTSSSSTAAPIARSDSLSSLASRPALDRPPSSREATWREEQAQLQHQLRLAKAEIANLQSKLGLKTNSAAFNTSSPRKTSIVGAGAAVAGVPLRKTSSGDLSALAGAAPGVGGRRRSATPEPDSVPFPPQQSPASPRQAKSSLVLLPEGAGHVAMNRALLSDEGAGGGGGGNAVETLAVPSSSPATGADGRAPSPSPSTSPSLSSVPLLSSASAPGSSSSYTHPSSSHPTLRQNGLPAPTSRASYAPENPFFGSTSSRERLSKSAASAQSGSGRVISGLQSDLLQARSALESTRGQLRLSQRAVEFLGRQNEDLKETRDRLTTEIDSLHRQITRKERLQEEALSRARVAEKALEEIRGEHRALKDGTRERVKQAEEGRREAEERGMKAHREYEGLREGVRSMSEGWRSDLKWLKSDLMKQEKEMEQKAAALNKLLLARSATHSTLSSTLTSLSSLQTDFARQHASSTSGALKELRLLSDKNEQDGKRAEELKGEFGRLRRSMAEYAAAEAQGGGRGGEAASGVDGDGEGAVAPSEGGGGKA
ncbi:hypothetical protein JCM10213_004146 [Rhodosporidiobolus nylandii]